MRQGTRTIARTLRRPPSRPIAKFADPVTVKSGWSLTMCGLTLICVFCATLSVRYLIFGG